ncbi:hypothetical protein F4560_006769 [Saccharothrix ecbatanensis]|uniref:Uncharacterized protein n=1 Tax=Saccharothrix ecbatanensis TaxID=1105145 RepID=A0A7W9HRS1_9PSEU|nr:hypothetical protein [Saccharothrix ecbatanensis]MBB5807001.1 hypothetical protein [Saccharothrix ecbatanensis]
MAPLLHETHVLDLGEGKALMRAVHVPHDLGYCATYSTDHLHTCRPPGQSGEVFQRRQVDPPGVRQVDPHAHAHRFAELAQSPETRKAREIEADAEDLYRAQVIERDLINVRRAMRRAGLTPPTNFELDQLDRKDTNR